MVYFTSNSDYSQLRIKPNPETRLIAHTLFHFPNASVSLFL